MGDVGNIGAAGINSAANLVIAGLNNANQRKIASEYNQAQRDLAEYQNDYNYQLWQENNEYNSPEQQMNRLEAAGLNPNLIYGSGSSVGNTSGPAPEAVKPDLTMPGYQNYDFGDLFQKVMNNYYAGRAQQAQIELAKTQQEFIEARRQGELIDNIMKGAATPFAKQIAERNVDMLESQYQTQRYREVSAYYDAQTNQYRWQHIVPLEERKALTDLALKDTQLNVSKAHENLIKQQTARIIYEIEHVLPQQVLTNEKQMQYLTEQIAIANARGTMLQQDAQFWENLGFSKDQSNQILSIIGHLIKTASLWN